MSDNKFPIFQPDITVSAREVFGVDFDMEVPAFSKRSEYVPPVDDAYLFDDQTTQAICAGFAHNRRVMIQGYHGTGKSTHICLLYTSPSPRDATLSRMPSSA